MPTISYTYDPCGRLTATEWDDGSMLIYTYDSCGNRLMTYSVASGGGGCKLDVVTQTDDFTADQASTYYLIDAGSGTITVTMAAAGDIGIGSIMKFKVVSGEADWSFDGSETFGHADGSRDQNLSLDVFSGVVEMTCVEQGFDET